MSAAAILILSALMAVGIGKYPRSKTPNPYTTRSFRLSVHPLAIHINRMCTLPGKHHMQKNSSRMNEVESDQECQCLVFSPCILKVNAVDAVFSQTRVAGSGTVLTVP